MILSLSTQVGQGLSSAPLVWITPRELSRGSAGDRYLLRKEDLSFMALPIQVHNFFTIFVQKPAGNSHLNNNGNLNPWGATVRICLVLGRARTLGQSPGRRH